MKLSQEWRLILMVLTAFILGLFVLVFNPGFRIDRNIESNLSYYPESSEDTGESEPAETLPQTIEF